MDENPSKPDGCSFFPSNLPGSQPESPLSLSVFFLGKNPLGSVLQVGGSKFLGVLLEL